MTFKTFIISKRPLWVDGKLHLTVDEMFELVEEWEKHQRERTQEEKMRDAADLIKLDFTQDNHLKTKG